MSRYVDHLPLNDPPNASEFLLGVNDAGAFRTTISSMAPASVPGSSSNPINYLYFQIIGTPRVARMWFSDAGDGKFRVNYEEIL